MAENIRVIGGYKCGCTYGPVWRNDRLEYCGVHGDEVANEYEFPSKAHLTRRAADKCRNGLAHVFKWDGTLNTPEMLECENCGIRR